jgi:hypothetical protein
LVKEDNIHIRIELCKDEISGNLKLMTYFDHNAPNFSKDEEGYIWHPTIEERDFFNEAFEFILNKDYVMSHPLEKREEKVVAPTPVESKPQVNVEYRRPEIMPPERREVMPEPQTPVSKEYKKSWDESSPFEKNDWKNSADQPPLEKTEREAVFEVTEEETKPKDIDEIDERVIAKADDAAIERALKKNVDNDKTIKEVDEQTIIEKVLSQKKKGKWSRNP